MSREFKGRRQNGSKNNPHFIDLQLKAIVPLERSITVNEVEESGEGKIKIEGVKGKLASI